jgi:hypothetical protein
MQTRLDQYIDATAATLKGLPEVDREQELAELRAHLVALTQAATSAGATEEQAMADAVRQFGAAEEVATDLRNAVRRPRIMSLPAPALAVLFAAGAEFCAEMPCRLTVAALYLANSCQHAVRPVEMGLKPTLLLDALALGVLLSSLRWRGFLREAVRTDTQWGIAAQWLFLSNLPISILAMVNYGSIAMGASLPATIPNWAYVSIVYGGVAALIVARRSRGNAYRGIPAVVLANALLAIVPICLLASVPGGGAMLARYTAITAMSVGLPTLGALAGAASRARRRTA